ncbi:MAG TPA: MATE family efflux transporter, partial [Gammaproteobacteria bacterium]|nr:MATE family efflux transporter [Gammaproteobacteria bacterium]
MSYPIILHAVKQEIKETLSVSVPLMSAQLIYSLSCFIGTALVAQLGEDALAASVLVSTIWMSLTVFFFGMLNAVSVLIAHQHGAKNKQAITHIMGQSFILGLIIGVLMMFVLLGMPFFMRFSAQPAMVFTLAYDYMYSLLWTIPALVILIILEQFLAGINHTKLVLRISLLIVPIEIPLIYALIFGKFGLPACGVAGIGYGFAITYTLTAICLVYYLLKSKRYQHYSIFKSILCINMPILKELARVGTPIGLMHAIEVSAFTL